MAVTNSYQTKITVAGMTCEHCTRAVSEALSALAGVSGVEVHLDSGLVEVTSEQTLDQAALAAAVHEAGYQLA